MNGFEIYVKMDRLSRMLGSTSSIKLEYLHDDPRLLAKLKELRDDIDSLLSHADAINQTTVQKPTGNPGAAHLP